MALEYPIPVGARISSDLKVAGPKWRREFLIGGIVTVAVFVGLVLLRAFWFRYGLGQRRGRRAREVGAVDNLP